MQHINNRILLNVAFIYKAQEAMHNIPFVRGKSKRGVGLMVLNATFNNKNVIQ